MFCSNSCTTSARASNSSLIIPRLKSSRTRPVLPKYRIGDTVFIVGDGRSCHEPASIVTVEYNRQQRAYRYNAVPEYNPGLSGLFSFAEADLKKSMWDAGAVLEFSGGGEGGGGHEMRVEQVKYWHGRFCYRVLVDVGVRCGSGGGWVDKREYALEEKELLDVVQGKLDQHGGFRGIAEARTWGAGAHLSLIDWDTCGRGRQR